MRPAPEYSYTLRGAKVGVHQTSFLSPTYFPSIGISVLFGNHYKMKWIDYTPQNQLSLVMGADANEKSKVTTNYDLILNFSYPVIGNQPGKLIPRLSLGLAYWLNMDITTKADNQNNPVYYNLSNMLCFSVGLKKTFGWLQIHNEFLLPLVGLYNGSEFSSSLPHFLNEDGARLRDALHVGSFAMNSQVANRLNLDVRYRFMHLRGTIRFQYEIATQRLNLNNNTKHYAFHTVRLGFLIQRTLTQYVHQ